MVSSAILELDFLQDGPTAQAIGRPLGRLPYWRSSMMPRIDGLSSAVVATERPHGEDGTIIKAEIGRWKIKNQEKALFARAEELPNWRLADKARRMLADLEWHFSDQLPETAGLTIEELDSGVARRSAVVGAGGIAVRAAGSAMALISLGYGPEAASPLRRLVEAKLNMEAVLDDETGQYAIRYLQGRPRGTTKLAQRYGNAGDIDLLSILTHADVRGLTPLHVEEPKRSSEVVEATFSVMPFHRSTEAEFLLHAVAYECGALCAGLADAFEVTIEIPPWISGQLKVMRDKIKQVREQREAQEVSASSAPPVSRSSKSKGNSRGRRRGSRRKR